MAVRAQIVLACAQPGASYDEIAATVGVCRMTVQVWRRRFTENRLHGLADRARPGRPKADLTLTDAEREQLTRWSRRAKSSQSLALRARIVLACAATGTTNKDVAAELRVLEGTVAKWRRRFIDKGLDGIVDESRPGRPSAIRQEKVDEVVAATGHEPPQSAKRWSRASMAAASGVSKSTIGRIWRRFDLQPHLVDSSDQ